MTLFGLEWYWWIVIAIVVTFSIPLKIKFVKWWEKRNQEKQGVKKGKWGEEE